MSSKRGIVYLVGAGPGDPELITVRGLRCLQQADVVAYDRLVHPHLLQEAPAQAECINVGKAPGQHRCSQAQINALLVIEAGRGKTVVRLKGGDPFVFGRGGEECQALAEAGIPFQVVPGISSATAVPAYAGIPVTQRQVARAFTVVTGHTAGSETAELDWPALVKTDTLVFLMGVGNLPIIVRQLMAHGKAPETPVALVRCGTTNLQEVVAGTLADIDQKASPIRPPAVIVVGPVVDLRQQIAWFESEGEGTAPLPTAVNTLPPLQPIQVQAPEKLGVMP